MVKSLLLIFFLMADISFLPKVQPISIGNIIAFYTQLILHQKLLVGYCLVLCTFTEQIGTMYFIFVATLQYTNTIHTRGGHKISDSGETHRNEYLLCKNFKTGFGFFVPRTVFSSQLCPRSPRTGSATG